MGADYTAMALIGLRIDPSDLHTVKTVKAFPHDYDEDMKYCPQTGKSLWETEHEAIEGYNEDKDTLFGYRIVFGTDHREAYVCVVSVDDTYSNGGNDDAMIAIDNIDIIAERFKMKGVLEPRGMWNASEFGLWSVLYCSY